MTTNSASCEILFRREGDGGGFIFHPSDAVFLHLDTTGFDTAVDALHFKRPPRDEESRSFVQALLAELPSGKGRTRLLEMPAMVGNDLSHLFTMPTLMDFQITERCHSNCPQCYAAAGPGGQEVRWEDARGAFVAMREAGVCQVAIGGGEPLTHGRFVDMLACVRDLGMVPNVTTTGLGITKGQLKALAEYCGAVALSLEGVGERFALRRRQGFSVFVKTVDTLLEAGVNLVLQVTLSAGNIDDLPDIVEYIDTISSLYGVIFLAHKPVGRAVGFDAPLAEMPFSVVHARLSAAVQRLRNRTRVGFDCCLTPLVAALEEDLGFPPDTILEGCSGARGSLGLTAGLDVVPCTFLPQHSLGNLRQLSLHEIWRGQAAHEFRKGLRTRLGSGCGDDCKVRQVCLGGCPVWRLVGCRYRPDSSQ